MAADYRASFDHRWHVGINASQSHEHFMYEAKAASQEVGRLTYWFARERLDEMPKLHRHCSLSPTVPVEDNHLTCCLGVECRKCPFLAALDKADLDGDERDRAKAWTCVAHVLTESGKKPMLDTSEGYVLTTDDRMFWDETYRSLAAGDPDVEASDGR